MFALCVAYASVSFFYDKPLLTSNPSVGITIAFVLPRVPGFQFNADNPLIPASSDYNKTVPTYFNRAPTNFSFPGAAQLQLDTGSNYIPINMHDIQADVYDLDTNMHIGTGHIDSLALPAKRFTQLELPLNFSYSVSNTSDKTCERLFSNRDLVSYFFVGNNWYDGCKNAASYPDGKRPSKC